MSTSTLMAHVGAEVTTYQTLAALPAPETLGRFHAPIPHVALVDGLREEVTRRGLAIAREQFALQRDGHSLFGVMDLRQGGALVPGPEDQSCLSIGFRNATNQALRLSLVGGNRVFICDNLCLSGDVVALARKNTSGVDLVEELRRGFDKFLIQADQLKTQLQQLAAFDLSDAQAKVLIFDAFAAKFLPARLFDDVDRFYFHADVRTPDCQPRTAWGLHNAFTRAVKDLTPGRQFEATQALGRHFGLKAGARPVIDIPAVMGHA